MKELKTWILMPITAIIGIIYTFVPPKIIVSWGIGFLRHNDRVLIGILCLIITTILIYKKLREK